MDIATTGQLCRDRHHRVFDLRLAYHHDIGICILRARDRHWCPGTLSLFSRDGRNGFTTVILLQLLIGGAVMVSLGIVGEYLARIYTEVKRRPRYVMSEVLSSDHV